jgi:hypothetical protein
MNVVALDAFLLQQMVVLERDPVTAALCGTEHFAAMSSMPGPAMRCWKRACLSRPSAW